MASNLIFQNPPFRGFIQITPSRRTLVATQPILKDGQRLSQLLVQQVKLAEALTAHLVMPEGCVSDRFLTDTAAALHTHSGIDHSTLQIETGHPDYPCYLEPESHV